MQVILFFHLYWPSKSTSMKVISLCSFLRILAGFPRNYFSAIPALLAAFIMHFQQIKSAMFFFNSLFSFTIPAISLGLIISQNPREPTTRNWSFGCSFLTVKSGQLEMYGPLNFLILGEKPCNQRSPFGLLNSGNFKLKSPRVLVAACRFLILQYGEFELQTTMSLSFGNYLVNLDFQMLAVLGTHIYQWEIVTPFSERINPFEWPILAMTILLSTRKVAMTQLPTLPTDPYPSSYTPLIAALNCSSISVNAFFVASFIFVSFYPNGCLLYERTLFSFSENRRLAYLDLLVYYKLISSVSIEKSREKSTPI